MKRNEICQRVDKWQSPIYLRLIVR